MVALGKLNILDSITRRAYQIAADSAVDVLLLSSIPNPPGSILRLGRLTAVLLSRESACSGFCFRYFCLVSGILRISLCCFGGRLSRLSSQFCRFSIILSKFCGSLCHQSSIFRKLRRILTDESIIPRGLCVIFGSFCGILIRRSLSAQCLHI